MLIDANAAPGTGRFARGPRGFTLIELLVTITLIGILLTVGFPAFSTWIRNAQIRTVTDALQNGVRTAQAEAVRRSRGTVIVLTNSAPGAGVTAVAGGKNWSLQTIAQNGESAEFISGGKLSDVASSVVIAGSNSSGAINALCFNSNGYLFVPTASTPSYSANGASCSASAATFDISQPSAVAGVDRPLRLLVKVGGQLRVCDPNRPALSPTTPDGC